MKVTDRGLVSNDKPIMFLFLFTFNSACKSSMDLISSFNLSIAVMKSATISAISFEVLPLSSLIVIGLSSCKLAIQYPSCLPKSHLYSL